MPVFKDWFGEQGGERYGRRYFMNVIGFLAATKLVAGLFKEAHRAFVALMLYERDKPYAIKIVVKNTAFFFAQQYFPTWFIEFLKKRRR
jgi:hypothetical protein